MPIIISRADTGASGFLEEIELALVLVGAGDGFIASKLSVYGGGGTFKRLLASETGSATEA